MKMFTGITFALGILSSFQAQAHDENCRLQVLSVVRCATNDKTLNFTITHKQSIQDPTTTQRCSKDLTHPLWAVFELSDSSANAPDAQIQSVIGLTSGETEVNIATIATNHIHLNYDRIVNRPEDVTFDLLLNGSSSRAVWSEGNTAVLRDVQMNCARSAN